MAKTFKQNIQFDASIRLDTSQIKVLEKALGEGFNPAMMKAARLGAGKFAETLLDGVKKATDKLEAIETEILAKQQAFEASKDEDAKKRLQAELKLLHTQAKAHKREIALENKAFESNLDRQEEMLKAYDDFVVKAKIDKKQLAADIGEALSGGFSKLTAGDLSGLMSSLGGGLSKGGGALEAAGLAAGGAEAGGMAAMAASLGPAIAALGATVGAVAAIAVVFQMAYDQSKKFNQALTEGAGAADFFSGGVGNMGASLADARAAIVDLGIQYRMDTEEIAKFTNALNTAGITYKEFGTLAGRAASDQQAFMDVTKTAIIASKSMGIEATDAASFMDRNMRDLGKTSLTEIQGAFGMINDAAARSGMTVKSFFTAISEATSGMALHNIRLEDTIGLMGTMTKVLGEDLAKERAKMEGQFRQMGYQERIKTVMTTGTGTTSKIVRADAEAQARAMGGPLKDAIGKVMPDLIQGTGEATEISISKLGSMTEEQYRKVVGALYASNDQNAHVAARQLDNMRDLARGAVRPGDELAQADAIGQLSKSGELAMQLASASAVLGSKGISSMEGLTRAAFEQITGQSGENFEIMKRLDRALRSQFEGLQQKVAAGGGTEEEKRFAKMDFTQAVAAGFGKATMEEGVRAGFTGMERMTEQMLTETQSFTTTLKNAVAWTLEKIYMMVEWIAKFLGAGKEAEALQQQNDLLKALDAKMAEQTAIVQEYNDLKAKESSMGLNTAEKARMQELNAKFKQTEVDIAGMKAGTAAFSGASSATVGAALAPVAQAAAEVAAGGGADAYAKEQEARKQATEFDWTGNMVTTGLAAALNPLAGLYSLYNDYEEYQAVSEAKTALNKPTSEGGVASGLDLLTESTGLTAEATEASKATLGELLMETKDDGKTGAKSRELLDRMLKEMQQTEKTEALTTLAGISEDAQAAVTDYLTTGKKSALETQGIMDAANTDPSVRLALESLGVVKSKTDSPVNDFIYRGGASGGVITPINSKDEFLGMKPGGAVDRAARGGSGGTVVININGDTGTIVRVVTDVLKKAGLTPSPSNGFA
jgi:hypothetical protein